MGKLISELIVSIDGCARGTKSPAYYGYGGPEFMEWLAQKAKQPHRQVLGRKTYEMLNMLPEEHRDDAYRRMTEIPGWMFSRTLPSAAWPGLEAVGDDAVAYLKTAKNETENEIRLIGSLSIVRELAKAGVLDTLRLIICPLALPESGVEPVFEGMGDIKFELQRTWTIDDNILIVDYAPNGSPPTA
ncbi:MAG: dihydrofolate reductase family protein [Paracoccaceae bacterium]|nr:dihydrofolate reductase family protein [Paracoccaceae bacterium]